MIRIITSSKNLPEKRYVFDILLNEFLGLEYKLENTSHNSNYEIGLPNGKKISINDHFWEKANDDSEYLSEKYLPQSTTYLESEFCIERNIPVLFGNPWIKVIPEGLECDTDIIATVFFFLSRWEEYISGDKDQFGRFKYVNSYAFKNNLIHRPVVNEYVEMLWKMLQSLDTTLKRIVRGYKPIITHDVDSPLRLLNIYMLRQSFARNIIKRKNYLNALRDLFVYPLNKINPKYDLGNTYDMLMDASESINTKSHFFFINSSKTKHDPGYSINTNFVQNVFQKIKNRGHIIGIHPSFYSLENPSTWKKEYDGLCRLTGQKIICGRQHFLRFNVPDTWQIWDNNDMETDFTLGYAEMEGFRCGTCYEFSVYNLLTREKLKLKESPLIFMEVSVTEYQELGNPQIFAQKLEKIVAIVKKYNGDFVFLYHNSFFDTKYLTKDRYMNWIDIIK